MKLKEPKKIEEKNHVVNYDKTKKEPKKEKNHLVNEDKT